MSTYGVMVSIGATRGSRTTQAVHLQRSFDYARCARYAQDDKQ